MNKTTSQVVQDQPFDQTADYGWYRGKDRKNQRPNTIKRLHPDLSAPFQDARAFRHHIQRVIGLQHPHLLRVLDAGMEENQAWLALPEITDASLESILETDGPLPGDFSLQIFEVLADALHVGWSRKQLVHGDLQNRHIRLNEAGHILLDHLGLEQLLNPDFPEPDPRNDMPALAAMLRSWIDNDASMLLPAFITLIEDMAHPTPEQRPTDWQEVLRRYRLIYCAIEDPLLFPAYQTHPAQPPWPTTQPKLTWQIPTGAFAVAIIIAALSLLHIVQQRRHLNELFVEAEAFEMANEGAYTQQIASYQSVIDHAPQSQTATRASERADNIRLQLADAKNKVMAKLDQKVAPALSDGDFAEAAYIYRSYKGAYQEETKTDRYERVTIVKKITAEINTSAEKVSHQLVESSSPEETLQIFLGVPPALSKNLGSHALVYHTRAIQKLQIRYVLVLEWIIKTNDGAIRAQANDALEKAQKGILADKDDPALSPLVKGVIDWAHQEKASLRTAAIEAAQASRQSRQIASNRMQRTRPAQPAKVPRVPSYGEHTDFDALLGDLLGDDARSKDAPRD